MTQIDVPMHDFLLAMLATFKTLFAATLWHPELCLLPFAVIMLALRTAKTLDEAEIPLNWWTLVIGLSLGLWAFYAGITGMITALDGGSLFSTEGAVALWLFAIQLIVAVSIELGLNSLKVRYRGRVVA